MAGSGFPPLPNIPYCCLPQESGPCLSTSVGDRPLRSPTHRRLGGPSPRLPSNGTHARPRPRLRFAHKGMPPSGHMAYHPAFPPAVRLSGVGCIRVTHPSATLGHPKAALPFDLHVLGLPLAFILSQDQTLRCTIVFSCFTLNLGFRFRSLVFLFPCPRPCLRDRRGPFSCAGLKLSKNSRFPFPSIIPLFFGESGCKSTAFPQTGNDFFQKFFIFVVYHWLSMRNNSNSCKN